LRFTDAAETELSFVLTKVDVVAAEETRDVGGERPSVVFPSSRLYGLKVKAKELDRVTIEDVGEVSSK